jgi:branched-chain amino acid transport system permease protein
MYILPFLISGLGLGAVYALSGVGLAVLFKASGTINFAFGALGAVSAHLMWSLVRFGLPESVALACGVGVAAAIAFLYGLLIAPLMKEHDAVVRSVATLGLTLVLLGAMGIIWGEVPRRLSLSISSLSLELFGARIDGTRIAALLFTLVSVLGIGLLLKKSRLGLSMRSVASNRGLSEILGISIRRVDAVAWLLSGSFAGFSGIFLANMVRLQPTYLSFLVIPAIAATIVGGLSSLPKSAVAGLVIGVVEATLTASPAMAPYRSVAPYLIALVVIAILPSKLAERHSV